VYGRLHLRRLPRPRHRGAAYTLALAQANAVGAVSF
jgi:hypothetical protein